MHKIPLYKPFIGKLEKDLVNQALDDGWISSKGKFVEEFENEFAKFVSRKHAISTANGTVALHLALEALELPKNSAVLCPSLTYVSTANAIRYAGLKPLFIDCHNTGVSEIDNIKKGLDFANENNIKVSAFIPVHLYGNCSDMAAIKNEINIPIIEDCAESVGSLIKQQLSGSHDTEFACFSFFGNKTMTTGEGGMIVCNDNILYEKCKILRNVGQKPIAPQRYQHIKIGYNYRLTNIACAIGIAQLSKINEILQLKYNIKNIYNKYLKEYGLDNLLLPTPDDCVGNNWLITIIMNSNVEREGLMLYLESKEIETRPAFLPMHAMVNLGEYYRVKNLSNSEKIGSCGINLPSYPELTEDEIKIICDNIRDFMRQYNG